MVNNILCTYNSSRTYKVMNLLIAVNIKIKLSSVKIWSIYSKHFMWLYNVFVDIFILVSFFYGLFLHFMCFSILWCVSQLFEVFLHSLMCFLPCFLIFQCISSIDLVFLHSLAGCNRCCSTDSKRTLTDNRLKMVQ